MHLLKNARGHLFLFQNNFSAFKYFYRASSEKKSPMASSEEKSPWASFSILKYFTAFKYFYRVFQKKETIGFFFYSQIFYQYSSIFTGRLQKKKSPCTVTPAGTSMWNTQKWSLSFIELHIHFTHKIRKTLMSKMKIS